MRGSVATADADKVGHARHNVKACSSSVEAADSYRDSVDPRRVNTTSLLHAIEGRHAKALLSAPSPDDLYSLREADRCESGLKTTARTAALTAVVAVVRRIEH